MRTRAENSSKEDEKMDKGYDWQKNHHLSILPLGHGTEVSEHKVGPFTRL